MAETERTIYAEVGEDGTATAKTKYTLVCEAMETFCQALQAEMKSKCMWRKQPAWGIRLKTKLNAVLRAYKVRPNAEATTLSESALHGIFAEFMDMASWLNETCDYTPTKQEFCAFAEISCEAYGIMLANGTEEQRLIISEVESYLADMQLDSAQAGAQKERSTEFRLTAKQFGHEIAKVTPVDTIVNHIEEQQLTEAYWLKKLESLDIPAKEKRVEAVKRLKSR